MTLNHQKFAINDKKQAELDQLKAEIARAEYKVDQLDAIVVSLTAKQGSFTTAYASAETDRATALNNLNMVKQVVEGIKEMVRKANTVAAQTNGTNSQINETADNISVLIDQLIYSAEVIDKLALLINKKQASKVLISAELVTAVNTASSDANSAIALTLTALNSCFTAVASCGEANRMTFLEKGQSLNLFGLVTGNMKAITDQITTAANLAVKEAEQQAAQVEWEAALKDIGWASDKVPLDTAGLEQCQAEQTAAEKKAKDAKAAFDVAAKATSMTDDSVAEYTRLKADYEAADGFWKKLIRLVKAFIALLAANIALFKAQKAYDEAAATLEKIFTEFGSIEPGEGSLYYLLDQANTKAICEYDFAQKALEMVNRELAQAQTGLITATVQLNSLNAGLAAATAAALAA